MSYPKGSASDRALRRARSRFERYPAVHMTESELQKAVVLVGHLYGWRIFHARTANTTKGFMTPISADGAGFPDLTMVREHRLLFVELKQDKRYPGPQQRLWITDLEETGNEVYVWRPSDWRDGTIERILGEHPTAVADS